MHKLILLTILSTSFLFCNAQTKKQNGWVSLFDGSSTKGWHSYGKSTAGSAWKAENGTLHLDASKKDGWQIKDGGDIVSDEEFENFHLKLEWKISKDGNSGIIFLVHEDTAKYKYVWFTGPEMQVLDNAGNEDGKIYKHHAGDLYDLIACSKETVKPYGEWNLAEIIVNKGKLELRLNGTTVVKTNLWDDNWKKLIAGSKFKSMPGFGIFHKGKIALQDHGFDVWFRNIEIKKL
ncbi:hypothetical protein GALL_128680 [mine drainage metagenome]|uniref:3-keto-alpha-glucoside-1,2-lyase/3-keto-2-hydroxy-glucal hydratase domain-containing protein n=1 Tax=mine drainage metagenome TaxID=410659 RepID=A0A1J5STV7_9ZZZZ